MAQNEKESSGAKDKKPMEPDLDFLSKIDTGPEKEEEKKPKKKLTKREIFIITMASALLVVLLAAFIGTVFASTRTPYQAIAMATRDDAAFSKKSHVAMVVLDEEGIRSAMIYKTNGGVAFAIVERQRSGYKVIGEVAKVATGPSDENPWVAAQIVNNKEYLVASVITQADMNKVKVNDKNAIVVDNGDVRCWFYIGEGNLVLKSDTVKYK